MTQTCTDKTDQTDCCRELTNCLSPEFFKALADPNRVQILTYLAQAGRAQKVTEVSCCCPVDVSVVSRHLGILREAGILEAHKQGREVYYSVRIDRLTALLRNLADALESCCPDESWKRRREANESG